MNALLRSSPYAPLALLVGVLGASSAFGIWLVRKMLPLGDEHEHACSGCGVRWTHASSAAGCEGAHTCPRCGRLEWWIAGERYA